MLDPRNKPRSPTLSSNEVNAAPVKSQNRVCINKPVTELVHIDPGIYQVALVSFATAFLFGAAPKLILTFKIVSLCPDFGKFVCRYYNVKKLRGKPRQSGSFEYSERSDVFREYCGCFGAPGKSGISMEAFKNVIVWGHIDTCNTDRSQRKIPEGAQYSRIIHLCGLAEGSAPKW